MKYKLTDETKVIGGTTLHRIKAIKTFGDVTEGDLGGWVETEYNLAQYGKSWVYGDAKVYGTARVSGNAKVCGNIWVCGDAWVSGDTSPKNSSVAKQLKEKGIKLGIKWNTN